MFRVEEVKSTPKATSKLLVYAIELQRLLISNPRRSEKEAILLVNFIHESDCGNNEVDFDNVDDSWAHIRRMPTPALPPPCACAVPTPIGLRRGF